MSPDPHKIIADFLTDWKTITSFFSGLGIFLAWFFKESISAFLQAWWMKKEENKTKKIINGNGYLKEARFFQVMLDYPNKTDFNRFEDRINESIQGVKADNNMKINEAVKRMDSFIETVRMLKG